MGCFVPGTRGIPCVCIGLSLHLSAFKLVLATPIGIPSPFHLMLSVNSFESSVAGGPGGASNVVCFEDLAVQARAEKIA